MAQVAGYQYRLGQDRMFPRVNAMRNCSPLCPSLVWPKMPKDQDILQDT